MDEQLIRYFLGELGAADRCRLLRQVEASEELKKQFMEYKNIRALVALSEHPDDIVANERDYKRFVRLIRRQKIRSVVLRVAAYAAAVALLIGFTYGFTRYYFVSKQAMSVAENTLYVPAGQRIRLTLSDGTEVWLNAQTRFTYPALFAGKERRVSLEGEAFFDVAKNPDRPFIVSSQGVEMKVLGTKFNVYGYPGKEAVRTSLLEGGLKVYFPHAESKGIILKPDEQVSVTGARMKVGPIPHTDYFLWKDGIYSFVNEPLIDILKKLELYYDVKIKVKDPTIYTWEYTGKFRQRDGIDQILHTIQRIHKFEISRDEENNIFTLSR